MITFETALEYALIAYPSINVYTEYENAWVFADSTAPPSIGGGDMPVVIEKETGNWTFLTAAIQAGFDFGDEIGEGEITREEQERFYMLHDAVYGAAVGDALGVPWEFMNRDTFECTGMASGGAHNQPTGTFSDDTSMMLATCDSIRELGGIRPKDLLAKFRKWTYEGEYAIDGNVFDVGNTVSRALSEGKGFAP